MVSLTTTRKYILLAICPKKEKEGNSPAKVKTPLSDILVLGPLGTLLQTLLLFGSDHYFRLTLVRLQRVVAMIGRERGIGKKKNEKTPKLMSGLRSSERGECRVAV